MKALKKRGKQIKKILVLIAVSILFHGCTKAKEAKPIVQNDNAAEELHEENMAVPEIESKYDDAFYESSDLTPLYLCMG